MTCGKMKHMIDQKISNIHVHTYIHIHSMSFKFIELIFTEMNVTLIQEKMTSVVELQYKNLL